MITIRTTKGDHALMTCFVEYWADVSSATAGSWENRQILGGFQNLRKITRHTIETNEERMAGSSTPMYCVTK
jgi:hypothetical protein